MRSIAQFTRRRRDLVFHLFHRALPVGHVADLRKVVDEYGVNLVWYDLDKLDPFKLFTGDLPTSTRLPDVIYARLLIDRIVDPSIRRILYLDSDLLIRGPIEDLYDIDMEGFPIAAVRDTSGIFITAGKDLANKAGIFDAADFYFNSGVLLIDLEKWRPMGITERVQEIVAQGIVRDLHYDQDILNLIFRNNWLRLPPTFNTMDARQPHEALDVHILHYTGPWKPWRLMALVAYRRIYRHTMTNELFYRYRRYMWKRWWLRKLGLRK
jgi:lipopolysaccharide biosynthesis glycosyltransferase